MTGLDRAFRWFIAPPPAETSVPPATDGFVARRSDVAPPSPTPPADATGLTVPSPIDSARRSSGERSSGERSRGERSRGGWLPPIEPLRPPPAPLAPETAPPAAITTVAVLGRSGEIEPIAAALGLALRRHIRARAATLVLLANQVRSPAGEGGGPSRRLAAQLRAQGLPARARGRLAWVELGLGGANPVASARRAVLVGAPTVLAVTVPRTEAIEALLAEQHLLVIVASEPDGPLARVAAGSLAHVPHRVIPPLPRGPLRAFARAGCASPRAVRDLLASAHEGEERG